MKKNPKVVLVHELLTQYGGAERVLEELANIFPQAPIYTLIYDERKVGKYFNKRRIITSPLQSFPLSKRFYKWYLPLMAWGTERLNLPKDIDLVISDSSSFSKGVKVPTDIPHICYLHTPTRYLWTDVRKEYIQDAPIPSIIRPLIQPVLNFVLTSLKRWDYLAAQGPNYYIANSKNIANRLSRYYDRQADAIIYPFVDVSKFKIARTIEDYFLILSRLEPYKKIDLALHAAKKLGIRLKVAGSGSKLEDWKKEFATYKNIEFLGRVPDEDLSDLYGKALAFIFPGEEDAGITPLEAMACGRPVLAFGRGGALETVIPGKTGEFFFESTVESLINALTKYEFKRYNQKEIRRHAQKFNIEKFSTQFQEFVNNVLR